MGRVKSGKLKNQQVPWRLGGFTIIWWLLIAAALMNFTPVKVSIGETLLFIIYVSLLYNWYFLLDNMYSNSIWQIISIIPYLNWNFPCRYENKLNGDTIFKQMMRPITDCYQFLMKYNNTTRHLKGWLIVLVDHWNPNY